MLEKGDTGKNFFSISLTSAQSISPSLTPVILYLLVPSSPSSRFLRIPLPFVVE